VRTAKRPRRRRASVLLERKSGLPLETSTSASPPRSASDGARDGRTHRSTTAARVDQGAAIALLESYLMRLARAPRDPQARAADGQA